MSASPDERYRVGAVDRAVAVLEAFPEGRSVALSEIARQTGLSEATALRYLSTLRRHHMVERDGDGGKYRLGLRLFELGQRSLADGDPRRAALPVMERLRVEYDETVNLAARRGDALVLIEAVESTRPIKMGARVGERDVWHASAVGKAILALLPEVEALAILEREGHARWTPKTLTELPLLREEFVRIRRRGYSIDDEEYVEGLRCVGAAVFDHRGQPAYAISVSGPVTRLTNSDTRAVGKSIRIAAEEISLRLGYQPSNAA
jgi:IclR family acetate operon transcriptional repressor